MRTKTKVKKCPREQNKNYIEKKGRDEKERGPDEEHMEVPERENRTK